MSSSFPGLLLPTQNDIATDNGVVIWKIEHPSKGFRLLFDLAQEVKLQPHHPSNYYPSAAEHAYEIMRIKDGMPKSPNEINKNYIPLELGLWEAVSFSKGCYLGQEIIARLESRGRLARRLTLIQLRNYAQPGSSIQHEGHVLDLLTSIISFPNDGWIGLGMLKPIAVEGLGSTVTIDESVIEIKIVDFLRV